MTPPANQSSEFVNDWSISDRNFTCKCPFAGGSDKVLGLIIMKAMWSKRFGKKWSEKVVKSIQCGEHAIKTCYTFSGRKKVYYISKNKTVGKNVNNVIHGITTICWYESFFYLHYIVCLVVKSNINVSSWDQSNKREPWLQMGIVSL